MSSIASTPPLSGPLSLFRAERVPVLVLAGIIGVLVPPFLVSVPPVSDYINHFARMSLIAGGADHAPLSEFYQVDWSQASTNIAIDLAAATAGRVFGVEILAPLLLGLSLALPPLGAVLLNRALFNGWHWWQVLFAAFAWSITGLLGFMNFQLGLGVALIGAALDAPLARQGPVKAVLVRMSVGAVLVLFHPFDVLFYAALLGGLALGPDRASRPWADELRRVMRAVLTAAPAVVPLVFVLAWSPAPPGTQTDHLSAVLWHPLPIRVAVLLGPFLSYGPLFDAPATAAAVGLLATALARRQLKIHFGLAVTAGGLAFLALLMPYKLTDTFFTDQRLPVMAGLTLLACTRPHLTVSAQRARSVAAVLFALVMVKTAAISGVWLARQADSDAVRRALAHVPAGSAVLPVTHRATPDGAAEAKLGRYLQVPIFWHYATLAITERRAFVPILFAAAGKQPVVVRPAWRDIASPNSPVIGITALMLRPDQIPTPFAMLRPWRERYQFVLVLAADEHDSEGGQVAPELTLVADEGFARLYAVKPPK